MAKPFKFADLYIPSVKQAMWDIYNGKRMEPIDQAELTMDIAIAIAKQIKKNEERDDG